MKKTPYSFPVFVLIAISTILVSSISQPILENNDPRKTELITTDIDNFWEAFELAKPDYAPQPFDDIYLKKGSKGLKAFTKNRIRSAEYLSTVVRKNAGYYNSIKYSTLKVSQMEDEIIQSLVKLKEIYPKATFPPVYFVIGALNSGGTATGRNLIIGVDMYGLTEDTPKEELSNWLKSVLKPIEEIPHIVAHEVIHFQQKYDGGSLLKRSIKEGAADFIGELISGSHINKHVHEFANPRERELWKEFQGKMLTKDTKGWLYSSQEGRPNDLGYWIGYKITKSYYDNSLDKKKAIDDIMHINNFEKFLKESKYADKFN